MGGWILRVQGVFRLGGWSLPRHPALLILANLSAHQLLLRHGTAQHSTALRLESERGNKQTNKQTVN